MSFVNRVIDWQREAANLQRRADELKKKAYEARESGSRIIEEAYLGMALLATQDAKRARRFAEEVKKYRTPNQTKVVLKVVLGEE